jgi:hypothetical protein
VQSYLVIANQTLVSERVVEKVSELLKAGLCRFHIVVPATRVQEGLTWTEGAARAVAKRRLEMAMSRFHQLEAEVTGEIGDENPILAALDALHARTFDQVLLCTLPSGLSAWLKKDLPNRLQRRIAIPVTHLPVERGTLVDIAPRARREEMSAA